MKRIAAAVTLAAVLLVQAPALADVSIIDAGGTSANHSQSNSQTQTNNTDQSDNRAVTVNQGGGDADASIKDNGGGNGNDDGALVNANVQAPVAVATGPALSPNVIVANNDILSNKSNSSSNSQSATNTDSSTTNQSKTYTVTDTSRSGNTASSIDRSVIYLPCGNCGRETSSCGSCGKPETCKDCRDTIYLDSYKTSAKGGTLPATGLPEHFWSLLTAGLMMISTGIGLEILGRKMQTRLGESGVLIV
ncbi:MAG: hypothetical protein ACR2M4_00560 [Actinomycetota bacterium]